MQRFKKNRLFTSKTPIAIQFLLTSGIVCATENVNKENHIHWATDRLTVIVDANHYSWKGDNNTSGNQSIFPITATFLNENIEYGLRTAWISSESTTSGREGRVNTLSDTALSLSINEKNNNGLNIRFNTDLNIPTGKSTLKGKEKNAIMDGALVQQTRFGEGLNITPGIVVTKQFPPNFSLSLGSSHTIRGNYDPNSDVDNDKLDPGDETRISLQGQYATADINLLGGIIFTHSDTTKVNNIDYYRKGNRLDVNATFIKTLPYQQRITVGARYTKQRKDTYINRITGNYQKENSNINGVSKYLHIDYAKSWSNRHIGHISADILTVDANSYDQINDLYNAGRKKWQVGIGYDYLIDPNRSISLSLKRFNMQDKATPATLVDTRYKGWNLSAGLNWKF